MISNRASANARRRGQRILQALAERHKALAAEHHMGMFEAGERQPEVVEPMIERLACDRDAEPAHVGDPKPSSSCILPFLLGLRDFGLYEWAEPRGEQCNISRRGVRRRVQQILNRLIELGFIRPELGLDDGAVYALTAAGSAHPQRRCTRSRQAKLPPLPFRSDRVFLVLSAINDLRAVRIKDLGNRLRIPQDSIRALMQYLKRREMVHKKDESNKAPYSLTEKGVRTLSEMSRRLAA